MVSDKQSEVYSDHKFKKVFLAIRRVRKYLARYYRNLYLAFPDPDKLRAMSPAEVRPKVKEYKDKLVQEDKYLKGLKDRKEADKKATKKAKQLERDKAVIDAAHEEEKRLGIKDKPEADKPEAKPEPEGYVDARTAGDPNERVWDPLQDPTGFTLRRLLTPQDERDRLKAYEAFRLEYAEAEAERVAKLHSDEILRRKDVEAKLAEAEAKLQADGYVDGVRVRHETHYFPGDDPEAKADPSAKLLDAAEYRSSQKALMA